MQGSFDDLGMPLDQVTFCVIDLETTGGTAADGGITTSMVAAAPPVDAVLPTLLEFIGEAVIVGHNVRYDLGYLNAALERSGWPKLANRSVDTLGLAHRPCHRALDDVLATADLLHLLLERAGRLGVLGLDDLIALPKVGAHPQAGKLKLTDSLPRKPGVYLFRSQAGDTLYVGKATNLRTRVRSYFSSDDRRKVGQLLKQTERIDHVVCPTPLEAAVLEVRLIHRLEPAFNRQLKTWRRYVYLKVGQDRLSIVKTTRNDDALYLGPLPSHRPRPTPICRCPRPWPTN